MHCVLVKFTSGVVKQREADWKAIHEIVVSHKHHQKEAVSRKQIAIRVHGTELTQLFAYRKQKHAQYVAKQARYQNYDG